MANLKISELTEATVINPADDLVVVQGGTTKRVGFDTLMYSLEGVLPWGRPPNFSDDSFDCGFEQSIGNWTAVSGSPGTISMLETTTTTAKYDITTLKRGILMQAGHSQEVSLRADRTLADGESVTAAVWTPGLVVSSGDNSKIGLGLTADNSDVDTGEGVWLGMEQDTVNMGIQAFSHDGATGGSTLTAMNFDLLGGWPILVRLIRSGLTYVPYVSFGGGWQMLSVMTATQALDNVWLTFTGSTAGQTYMPVGGFAWVKFGDAAFTPW